MTRRTLRVGVLVAVGCLVGSGGLTATPSYADGGTLGGFTGSASATPLRIEVHEQAIPVPADPELELDLMFTRVSGDSGPTSSALGSALWPGDTVGQGLPALGTQLGLPSQLTASGYPVQVNAASPGGPATASQEPLPGLVTTVKADEKGATAVAGLGTPPAATPTDGTTTTAAPGIPGLPGVPGLDLSGILDGLDLSSLTSGLGGLGALGGSAKPKADPAPSASPTASSTGAAAAAAPGVSSLPNFPNPLGALSAIVSIGAATSTSSTSFASDALTNRAITKLADIDILGGIIHIDAISVSATSKATLDGAKDTPEVDYAGVKVLGQPVKLTSDGLAAGQGNLLPGLGLDPSQLLSALGITLKLSHADDKVDGSNGTLEVRGPELTIDTTPLRSKLPTLPLASLLSGFPAEAEQLVSLLLALNEAHPKIVVALGDATAATAAVAPLVMPGLDAAAGAGPASVTNPNASSGTSTGATPAAVTPADVPAVGAPPASTVGTGVPSTTDTDAVQNTAAAAPGLPPLGSLPGLLLYGGLALAAAAGWWVRRAGLLMLGGGAACSHGLRSGLPDLRKVSR